MSICDGHGFNNNLDYLNDVHQYVFPNYNSLHGVKAAWSEEYNKFENGISPSLRLMQLINSNKIENS